MGDKTGIEWTDATWNPIRGCSRVSEGCRNCYAETVANRFKGPGQPYEGLIAKGGQWNGTIRWVGGDGLTQPLRWRRPRRVFVNSMSDLFHEAVPADWIDQIFAVMASARHHTFQVLTKRPDRMRAYMATKGRMLAIRNAARAIDGGNAYGADRFPLPNVWLGVSVEDQKAANERIPHLLDTPAAVRWISAEPLLGPVYFDGFFANPGDVRDGTNALEALDWVVVGGESGPHARPMHPQWARDLRDQCAAAGVPFLFKQWGEWAPPDDIEANGKAHHGWWEDSREDGGMPRHEWPDNKYPIHRTESFRVGKKAAGRLLDGVQHDGYPEAPA